MIGHYPPSLSPLLPLLPMTLPLKAAERFPPKRSPSHRRAVRFTGVIVLLVGTLGNGSPGS